MSAMVARRPFILGGIALFVLAVGLVMTLRLQESPSPASHSDVQPANTVAPSAYRWITQLEADSSLFDRSQAPEALRVDPFTLRADVTGDRIGPDREHIVAVISPVAIQPRESVTIGQQRWHRTADGPWQVGPEPFPAARAYLGRRAQLAAPAFFEPAETPALTRLRQELEAMPYVTETRRTGPARHYRLSPEQVSTVLADDALNPFPVLRTLPAVRIDVWVDEQRRVLVGVRVHGDSVTRSDAFMLGIEMTEIDPERLQIEAPR